MSAAAVVFALALICLIVFFVMETRPKKTFSMLDLAEFKDLPHELRAMIRSSMPKPSVLKKQWLSMTPQQKQMVQRQLASQFPQPGPPPPPAPSQVIKPAPSQVIKPSGLKPGFLLSDSVNKGKKKDAKNKKEDEIVTLSDIGASEEDDVVSLGDTDN